MGRTKPSQANLRRAVSSAYYALFHCLARSGTDLLVGGAGAERSKPAWRQVYRALDHGTAKAACGDGRLLSRFPKPIEDFGNVFLTLQKKRHSADYDPFVRLTRSDVLQDIATAEQAIRGFSAAALKDRRAFCTLVLFKKRHT